MTNSIRLYCEPFFGSGALCWSTLRLLPASTRVIVADLDPGITALWQAVRDQPQELTLLVRNFRPSRAAFERFKTLDGRDDLGTVQQGFRKLAMHRLSSNALGAMAGGPLGGKASTQGPVSRWRPARLAQGSPPATS
jgi:site-specific DNA-adenine methylase